MSRPGVTVVRPGMLTSVQDLGRYGLQHLGIVPGGAMDTIGHRIANMLVGNPVEAATLECTLLGPAVQFESDALVALYGADFDAKLDGLPLPRNRPVLVTAGATLVAGSARRGARAYLAMAGGFQVPAILGSRSTYMPAAFGGLSGRALKPGDRLPGDPDLAELSRARFDRIPQQRAATGGHVLRAARWFVPGLTLPSGTAAAGTTGVPMTVRAMAGRHHGQFDAASLDAFFTAPWRISPSSNRMGYRLEGPSLTRTRPVDVLSEPTCLGTVQVPNDGAPIALMADHQTTGGYPKIAEIAGADIPRLAQLPPGSIVRFVRCTVDEAEEARAVARERMRTVLQAIESMMNDIGE